MKSSLLLRLVAVLMLGFVGVAHAASSGAPTAAQSGQQNKMKACAQQYHAQNIPKNQYHTFMSGCLKKGGSTSGSAPTASAAPATSPTPSVTPASTATPDATAPAPSQKDKMRACNKDAKTQSLKGDARKAFMKDCLSK